MKKWQIPVIIVLVVGIAVLIYFLAKQTKTKAVTRAEVLRELYDKVQELEPPIDFSENLNSNSFYFINGNDSLIFSNESMVLGALKDTSRFFTFVQIGSGDSYYPILVTFNKKGKLLSTLTLWTEDNGDCGYSINSKSTLDKNLKLDMFSREESQECNDEGPYGPTTITESVQSGQISKKGKIIMQKPVVKKWLLKDSSAVSSSQTDSII